MPECTTRVGVGAVETLQNLLEPFLQIEFRHPGHNKLIILHLKIMKTGAKI